jgi:UV DNA damage endonuclease
MVVGCTLVKESRIDGDIVRFGIAARPSNNMPYIGDTFRDTLENLMKIADFLNGIGIDFYRFPSKILPVREVNDVKLKNIDMIRECIPAIQELGTYYRTRGIRTCFHVSEYCNPVSLNPIVVQQSVDEIEAISTFLNYFNGGWVETRLGPVGRGGTKVQALDRFGTFIGYLSESAISRIKIENDDRKTCLGACEDLISIHDQFKVGIIFNVGKFVKHPKEHKREIISTVEAFLGRWGTGIPVVNYENIAYADWGGPLNVPMFWEFVEYLKHVRFDSMILTERREFDVMAAKRYANDNGLDRYLV